VILLSHVNPRALSRACEIKEKIHEQEEESKKWGVCDFGIGDKVGRPIRDDGASISINNPIPANDADILSRRGSNFVR